MAVVIDIVTQFKGKKNIQEATHSVSLMNSAVEKLGKTFAATFAVEKIVQFGKDAFTAFSNDQKAAALLGQTLKNIGQQFQDSNVEKFITDTSLKTGVLKNDLRDAFSVLVRSTKDAAQAQNLLNLALDISAGTGKDLNLVSLGLSKAYLGNTTAISRLGIGLTNVQLKGKTWLETQTMLNRLFKGDAATAADTYAGKIAKLKAGYEEAKVTIGSGIADAFSNLSQNGSIDSFVTGMQTAAQSIADIVIGLGVIGGKLVSIGKFANKYYDFGKLFETLTKFSGIRFIMNLGKNAQANAEAAKTSSVGPHGAPGAMKALQDEAKAAAADAAALAKLNAEKAKKLKLEKDALALKQAAKTLDLQAIEIAAALQNKNLTEKDKAALELQAALLDQNANAATQLAAQITIITQSENNLRSALSTPLPTVNNPYVDVIKGATQAASLIAGVNSAVLSPELYAALNSQNAGGAASGVANSGSASGVSPLPAGSVSQSGPIIYVTPAFQFNIDGSVITDAVTLQQIQNTAAGVAGSYNRSQTFKY